MGNWHQELTPCFVLRQRWEWNLESRGSNRQRLAGRCSFMLGGWTGGSVPLVGWCVVAEESTPFIVRTISSDSDSLSTATNAIFSGQLLPLSLPVSQCDARKGATEPDRHAPLIAITAEATEHMPRGLQASTALIRARLII